MNNPFITNKLGKEVNVLQYPHYLETIALETIDWTTVADPQKVAHFTLQGPMPKY